MLKPYVHAPLPFESITFLTFTHLPLPSCLFDSAAHSGICLTLAVWMIYGPLGLHSLHSISYLDWALFGCGPSPSYLAHVHFCPMSVGWPMILSCHCTTPAMISLILLLPLGLWAEIPASSFLTFFLHLGFIGQHSCWANPFLLGQPIPCLGLPRPIFFFLTSFTPTGFS